jgi:hypothetical protein
LMPKETFAERMTAATARIRIFFIKKDLRSRL